MSASTRALGDTSGLVKFVADAKTDAILGVQHVVGTSMRLEQVGHDRERARHPGQRNTRAVAAWGTDPPPRARGRAERRTTSATPTLL